MAAPNSNAPTLPGIFDRAATPAGPRRFVTVALDADALDWLRSTSPDWQGQLDAMLCFFHDKALTIEGSFDPDGFEPGELVADVPPEIEPAFT